MTLAHDDPVPPDDRLDDLFSAVYEALRGVAHRHLRGERTEHTLGTTGLVHEAWLELERLDHARWPSRAYVLASASRAMRRILIDYAVARRAQKRGGGMVLEPLDDAVAMAVSRGDELLALDEALDRLAAFNERWGRVVECRFFGGMTVEETAEALAISPATVKRDWTEARAWLNRELSEQLAGEPGRMIGGYRVFDRIGGGSMGVVYRALDPRDERSVALKFLRQDLEANASAGERFRLEARTLAALEHPHICTVHEIGETERGQPFIVMPLYDGETLKQRIARGPLPVAEAVEIAVQIARALGYVHARGIIHRDVKPSNVMVTGEGVAKLFDFGIAKVAGMALTGAARPLGTMAYMSPEQLAAKPVKPRDDLWSLGAMLYEMLAGRRPFPFEGPMLAAAIQRDEPPVLSRVRPGVAPALDRLIVKALAKRPRARYQVAADLERDLSFRA